MRSYAPIETITVTRSVSELPKPSDGLPFHPVRVAIVVKHSSVKLWAPVDCSVSGLPESGMGTATHYSQKYSVYDVTVHDLRESDAYIKVGPTEQVQVDGNWYKGDIEILSEGNGTLTVVNQLSLDDYVMGVLAGEIPGSWPPEALKAQAIAARTFAVYKQAESRRKNLPYDLENTALYQMYIGSRLVNESIRQAVLDTQGEILTYQDQPIMAVFHSNCGGETSNSEEVWGKSLPYLRATSCAFDKKGKHYRWDVSVPEREAARKLKAANVSIYDITGIAGVEKDRDGRVLRLTLIDGEGRHKKIKGTVFRMAVGPDVVRSTRFDIKLEGDHLVMNGTGWGHGVGLCQEGTYGMAVAGYGAFDILRHYYYGVILDKLRD